MSFDKRMFVLQVMPHNHQRKLAKFYYADKALVGKAIEVATAAQKEWDRVPIIDRLVGGRKSKKGLFD